MRMVLTALTLGLVLQANAQTAYQFVQMGNAKMEQGNSLGAVKDYSSAILADSLYAQAYLGRGSIYAELNLYREALSDLNRALSLDSGSTQVYFNRAYVHVQTGDYPMALQEYDRYILANPTDPEGYLARAELELLQGGNGKADFLNYLTHSGNTFEELYVQSGVLLRLGDTSAALRKLDECIRLKPEAAEAYRGRGELFSGMGRDVDAIRDLSTALVIADHGPTLFKRAAVYARSGDIQMALADCARASTLDPQSAVYPFQAGVYAMELHQFGDALQYFLKAEQNGFDDRGVLNYNLGICAYNSGKTMDACTYWMRAEDAALDLISEYCRD